MGLHRNQIISQNCNFSITTFASGYRLQIPVQIDGCWRRRFLFAIGGRMLQFQRNRFNSPCSTFSFVFSRGGRLGIPSGWPVGKSTFGLALQPMSPLAVHVCCFVEIASVCHHEPSHMSVTFADSNSVISRRMLASATPYLLPRPWDAV